MNNQEQILQVVENYKKAIHTQNKDDFYQLWSKQQCSLISITKTFIGLDHIIQEFLIDCIQAAYQTIDLISEDIQINMIQDDYAIVIFQYHTECIKRDTLESYGIQGLETQVMIKEDHEWKLLHVHYSKA